MKSTVTIVVTFAVGLAAIAYSQDAGGDKTQAIMQSKLEHSQALLEGLTTEDYEGLAKHANALTLLSLEADWNILQTAEYRRLSEDFRRSTKRLTDTAKNENLDGATLAYVGVTVKCVECHKYVRSVQTGQTR